MRWIPGGRFRMGSEDFYPDERPVHEVEVDGFWMDQHQVTNAEFRRFVKETGYVTVAERPLDPADYPDADPDLLVPGSLVFQKTGGPGRPERLPQLVGVRPQRPLAATRWPGTTFHGKGDHPVVHIAWEDARGLCRLGGQGPAHRGGVGVRRPWGAGRSRLHLGRRALPRWQGDGQQLAGRVSLAEPQGGRVRGDLARGQFPRQRLRALRHGGERLGMDQSTGTPEATPSRRSMPAVSPPTPRVTSPEQSYNPGQPGEHIPRRVIKGGSHLCAPNYCLRYRPAARQPQMIDTSMSHLGFRCVVRDKASNEKGEAADG